MQQIKSAHGRLKERLTASSLFSSDATLAYAAPQDVLRDSALSYFEKRDALHRWALDAYLAELAISKGAAGLNPSRLSEVIDALIDLDEPELRRIVDRASRLHEVGSPLAA